MSRLRAEKLTKHLRTHDRELYARYRYGRIDIMRRGFKHEPHQINDEFYISFLVRNDYHVMSLTDTWNMLGKPVDWGIEPVMARIKAIDLQARDLAEEMIRNREKELASEERDMDNHLEAFWKDNRRAWAKNFDQVNRSTLDKKRDRRYDDEKKLKLKGL